MLRTLTRISLSILFISSLPLAAAGLDPGPFPSGPAITSTFYTFSFSPAGGSGSYSYSVTSGTLPPGLSLAGTNLSGIPAVPGTYAITFTVTDTANGGQASVAGNLTVNAGALAAYTDSLAWQTASTGAGTLNAMSLPGTPGGGAQYSNNFVSVPPATIAANTLFDCGGTYPTCGGSAGTGWLKGGPSDGIAAGFPGFLKISSVGAHFAASGGNSPTTLQVIAVTLSGNTVFVDVDPAAGTTFVGFVSSNPADPITSIGAVPDSSLNSPAMTDFSYYGLPPSSTTLTTSPLGPAVLGTPITLTASVSPGSATGTVTFYNGAAILGSRSLVGGQAQLTTSLLPAGANLLRAFYSGDASLEPGTSVHLTQNIHTNLQNGFQTPVIYSTGGGSTNARAIAAGDFNGDNVPDLAVTNYSGNSGIVALVLGNSNGTFGSPTPYSVGTGARAVAVGDFNADGKSDLAVASLLDSTVSILLGNGDGTFQTAVPYSTGAGATGPVAVVIADFNGDGKADVATANPGSATLSIFPGNGNGTLGNPSIIPATSGAVALVAADFDGDGLADIAVPDASSGLDVYLASGGFTEPAVYDIGLRSVSLSAIAAADVNNDGLLDLIAANSTGNSISVSLGDLQGNFGTATSFSTGAGSTPSGLAIGDFNGDGKLDVAVAAQNIAAVEIMTGDNQGGFVLGVTKTITGAPTDLVAADFNGDGRSDLVASNQTTESVSVVLGALTVWGDQPVTISWQWPDLGAFFGGPQTATVGSGVEFPGFFPNNAAFNVDFSQDTVQMISNQTRVDTFDTCCTFNGLVIEPGAGSQIPPFTSVSLTSSNWPDASTVPVPFERWRLAFDATHIYADFRGIVNQANDSITIKVNQALTSTTTTLTSGTNPSDLSQPVSFTAAVPSGASGVVSFFKDSVGYNNFLGDATISGTTAVFTTSSLPAGSNTIVAYYNGDSTFDASTSNPVTQVVRQTSSTTITSSKNPAPLGFQINFQIHGVAFSTINVTDGATLIGTASPNSDGFASFQTSSLTPGVHTITATFPGNATYAPSSGSVEQTILPGTTLTLSTPGGLLGQPIPLTATVSPSDATGLVVFYDGATMLGSAGLNNGTAILNTPLIPSGVRSLHAHYQGSISYSPSTSAQVTTTITVHPQAGFVSPVTYSTGPETLSSVIGDFNGDGKQDVAVLDVVFNQLPPFGKVTILLGAGNGTFQAGQTYPLGNDVHQVLIGDFNKDGIADLLVADGSYGVIPLTGAGDGTFSVGAETNSGIVSFQSAALGDFNGDGIPDLLGGDETRLVLFFGDGAGAFTYGAQITDSLAAAVTVADIDKDGNADVIWRSDTAVQIARGHGNGTFDSPQSYIPGGYLTTIAVADYTGDNWPDVAVGTTDTNVIVLPNNTAGAFGTPITLAPGGSPAQIAAGDYNADGKQDIIAVGGLSGTFYLIPSQGAGAFGTPETFSSGLTPFGLSTGSFAGDGRLSLALPNGVTDDVGILLAQLPPVTVTCDFTTPVLQGVAFSTTCTAQGAVAPQAWSFTGNLPTGLSLDSSTGIISGTPTATGSFSFSITAIDSDVQPRTGTASYTVVVATPLQMLSSLPNATRNSPYSQDLVSGGTTPYTCSFAGGAFPSGIDLDTQLCRISGTPFLAGPATFTITVSDAGSPPQAKLQNYSLTVNPAITTTTINSDINPSSFAQTITLSASVSGVGGGTMDFYDGATLLGSAPIEDGVARVKISTLSSGTHSLTAHYAGDSNNQPSVSDPISQVVLPQTTTTLTIAPANPLFGQQVTLTASVSGGAATGKVTFYDGSYPLGTATLSGGQATLSTTLLGPGPRSLTAYYLGSPALSFSTSAVVSKTVGVRTGSGISGPTDYAIGPNVRSVAIGDFNRDGIQDLAATTSATTNSVAVLLGKGDGTFQNPNLLNVNYSIAAVVVGDFNGDGIEDLAVATPGGSGVTIMIGVGDGTFGAPSLVPATAVTNLAVGDFNHDGNSDLALGNSGSIYILPGNGDGTFGQLSFVASTSGPTAASVTVADFDGDGNADIASTDELGTVRILAGFGDGTFALSAQRSITSTGISITNADLNGDGHPDLIVGANGVGVRVLMVDANGVPANPVTYTAGNVPGYVTTGDFDGDGKLDIAAADFSSNNVHILTGNGDGTFNAAVAHSTTYAPFAVAAGNFFGGTGRGDLLVGYANQDVSVLLNTAPAMTLTCTPASAPPVLTGVPYTINCSATNGIAPLTFAATGLPPGLTVNSSTGVISGTPTTPGGYTINVQVSDSDNPQGGAGTAIPLTIVTPMVAAPSPLPTGLAGSPYSTTVYSGGTPPYTCGLNSGAYAPGLTMDGFTCVLSGTPTTPGVYSFGVGNSDSGSPQQNLIVPFSLTIQQTTTTSLTPSANPGTAGQNLTLTAQVSPGGASGAVTFLDGSTAIGTGTLDGNGLATLTLSSLSAGTHSLTAAYAGDATNTSSTSSVLTESVKNTTNTDLTSSANPAPAGQNLTFTATVSPSSATGTVTFTDKGNSIGTGTLSNGVATLTLSSLALSDHTIVANYGGDASDFSSSSNALTQIIRTTTTTSLTASPTNSAGLGAQVTLTATVSPVSNGQVTFYNNGATVLGTSTLSNGVAILTTGLLPAGPNKLTAYYLGDPQTFPSTSSGVAEAILPAPQGGFDSGVSYLTGSGPWGSAVGDFNHDGKPDVAVAGYNSGAVSVHLGTGVGTFSPASTLPVSSNPFAVAVADFNGDGNDDIANTNLTDNSIYVQLGNGDGTFGQASGYSNGIGDHPSLLVASDFDGDGFADLATINYESGNVSVLRGVGNGTFETGQTYVVGGHPAGLVAGDFNNDGKVDLATANQDNSDVSILINRGDGTFGEAAHYPAGGTGLQYLAAYDLNGDGVLDLISANAGSNDISVLNGTGTGAFDSPSLHATGAAPYWISPGDFNGDGKVDLAVSNNDDSTVTVFLSDGSGALTSTGPYSDNLQGGSARGVSVADVNRDGISDLIVSGFNADKISVLLGLVKTTTTLTSTVNPSVYGQTTTLNVTVAPSSAAGSVTFFDGATSLGSTGLSGGATSLDISSLNAGTHSLTARYNGDIFDAQSTSAAVTQTVQQLATNTTLTAVPNPSQQAQSIALTATVIPAVGSTVPTGFVTFFDGSTNLQAVALNGVGQATLNISNLSAGTHSLTAVYSGDSNDTGSTSSAVSQTVQNSTTTTLTSSLNPSTFGATTTLTATISIGTATGNVTFFDGSTALGTVALSGGAAQVNVSSLSVGSHSLTAVYGGDANNAASTSSILSQTVNQAVTATTLTSSLNPSSLGVPITLTASVSPAAATGTVTFKDGATVLDNGTVVLTNGVATLQVSSLTVGAHSLTAVYNGDTNDAPSTSSVLSQTVDPGATSVFLSGNQSNVSVFGEKVTFTANVTPSTATGTVTFRDGSNIIDTGTLAQGVASIQTPALSVGVHAISATYEGDSTNAPSASEPVIHTVAAITAISLSSANNGFSLYGQDVQIVATLDPAGATGKVTFYNGTTILGTSILANGTASITTSLLQPGINHLTAYYGGDASNAVSRSPSYQQLMLALPGAGFQTARSLPSGSQPSSQTAGDFNNDGITDLAVTNFADNEVAVLFGNGDGTFQNSQTYSTGAGPSSVAAGDFNLDGVADLAVTNSSDNTVSILTGTGQGSFTSGAVLSVETAPASVAVADFNADGIPDLAVANSGDDDVSILMGAGDGTFTEKPSLGAGSNPRAIAVADFNNDGRTDLAVTSGSGGQLPVFLGNGDGSFSFVGPFGTGQNTTSIAVADFNNDGNADLAVANHDDNTIGILAGNGDGTFQPQTLTTVGTAPTAVAQGDFNGDGTVDLAVTHESGSIEVLRGNPDGTFQTPANFSAGTTSVAALAADLNFDGRADLAIANRGSGDVSVLLAIAQTQTSLTSSVNPSVAGQSITFTASVSPSIASGSVTFKDGSTVLQTVPMNEGVATLDISSLSAGSHSITGTYSGDPANSPSTSDPVTQIINQSGSSTSLTSSANPSAFGTPIALTAIISPSTATGNVVFRDGSTTIGAIQASQGTAVLNISTLAVGTHSLTAVYAGDGNNVGSVSQNLNQVVNPAPTSTTLTTSLSPSNFGTQVTLTATVAPASATGSVTFKDGATTLATLSMSGGTAALNISTLAVGAHILTAVYSGDTNNASSSSQLLNQTVDKTQTTTAVTSSLNPSSFGAAVTLTATVTPSSATGSVTFIDGETTLGTQTLSGGTASLTLSTLTTGPHSIFASYQGDSNDNGSGSSPYSQTVNKAPSTVTLTSSTNTPSPSQPVTLTVTVAPSTATGSVTFKDGTATLGVVSLNNGVATLVVNSLASGSHTLTALYDGDKDDAAGQGSLTVNATATAPVINTSSLPAGQVGVSYGPVIMQASEGSGTYSWSATGLPVGLGMSSSGALSGTASDPFDGAVTVTVTDPLSAQSSSKTFNLSIVPVAVTINGPSSLGITTVGGTLTGSFAAQGGSPPYTWSLSGAAGFSIDQNGKVTGTPGQAGDSSITVQVKDSSSKPLTAVFGSTFSAFGLTTGGLPAASTLTDYSASLSAAGGTPPYTFSATGLPANLGISGSAITGRALSPGTFTISLKASDSKGLSASTTLLLTVTGPGPLKVLSTSLSDGTASQPFSGALSAQGGSPAYTWSLSGGVLPPGLSLDTAGNVFGTPTLAGSFSFGVQVTDTAGGKVVGAVDVHIAPAALKLANGNLPSGVVGSQYPIQLLSPTGGVAPYSFTAKGSLPDGLSLSSDGQISGTPTKSGDFSFSVVVTDSASPAASGTVSLSVSVRPSSADLILSAATLSFSLTSGTSAVPSATSVSVTSSQASQLLNFTTAVSGPSWLLVSPGGSTPSSISVGLAPSALELTATGSPYSGTVLVTCATGSCAGKAQSINVTLTVTSPPPQLSVTSSIFSFVASTANPQASSAALGIQNSGGGKLTVNSVSAEASWLLVSSFSGDVLPGPGAAVTVTADPGSLPAGYYTSSVSVKTSAGNASIPVTLLISSQATMVLGPDGAQFSMPVGGTLGNPAGSFLVSVSSTVGVSYTASVLPGAAWLTGGGAGSASSASPGVVQFSINAAAAAALPVGAYYGTIRVSGSGIVNTPQDFQVVLSISPAATPVVPDPQPGGLLFLSATPGVQPPQSISVYASSKTPLTFQASATGGKWLSISSTSGSASAGSPAQLNALVDSTGLVPGVYSGAVNFASGAEIRSVTVTLVVQTPAGSAPALVAAAGGLKSAADSPTCANAKLVPAPTALASNFSAPAAWPTPISMRLVDTCGSVVGRGQIVATFSNGDPPLALSLVNATTGLYSGTWTPRRTASQTLIKAQATASGYSPSVVEIAGQVTPNAAPQLVPNGTLDVFHPQVGAGLGPGNIVQIYGTSLASQPTAAETLPLPTKVAGTQVLIGGVQAPLFYVSPTQVNAQIPFELQAGQQYQVIVNANGALTTPQPIQLTAAVPALLQFTSGLVIAQHTDGSLVSDTAPAAPGENIVLYMTGLGATDVPVPTGDPSPADPLARVLDVPVLTLDEITVPTQFAGLTPGLVGLYQINIQVPADLPEKTYDLKVTQSGTVSNSTSLPVKAPAAK